MSLLFVPFYLRILGVEAYGLIGIYTSLLVALTLLDAGLRPTLGREMARFTGGGMDAQAIRTLLRSVELPMAGLSCLMLVIMALAAPWLAQHWAHPQHIPPAAVAQAFAIMGFVAGAQFVESVYDSCLSGLQRQVLQSAIVTLVATLRGFGALVVLWVSPTIITFFLWQGVVALASLAMLGGAVYRTLPSIGVRARFSFAALRQVRAFAAGMLGIAIVSLLLSQSDKLLLAHFMPLAEVGRYTLAASLSGTLSMLSMPINTAFYPRLTELIERGSDIELARTFHHAAKLATLLVGTAAAMLILFGERLMNLWLLNPTLSMQTAPILVLLATGMLFSALIALPYMLQVAHGMTSLTLRINIVMLLFFIPGLIVAIMRAGAWGAALCWALLNLCGLIASAFLTFRYFLRNEGRRWWLSDVCAPLGTIFLTGLVLRETIPRFASVVGELVAMAFCGGVLLCAGILIDGNLRATLTALIHSVRRESKARI